MVAATCFSFVVSAGCDQVDITPDDRLELYAESPHFAYYVSRGDSVDADYQERHYAWATGALGLTYLVKIDYRKYRDRAHLELVTGRRTNGFAEPDQNVFHTIWPIDNHEWIHVVFINEVGEPPALFSEGVCVAHHGASLTGSFDGPPLWNGASVHVISRTLLAGGNLPGINELAVTNDFRSLDDQTTYPVAGSFVRFLIDTGGVDPFKQFSASLERGSSRSAIDAAFESAYGETLASRWSAWRAFLLSSHEQ